MTRAWETLDSVSTERGALELRRRGERDFLITIGGRVLMNSTANRSEIALAELARRYGSSINAIVRANNLRSRNRMLHINFHAYPPGVISGLPNRTPTFMRT